MASLIVLSTGGHDDIQWNWSLRPMTLCPCYSKVTVYHLRLLLMTLSINPWVSLPVNYGGIFSPCKHRDLLHMDYGCRRMYQIPKAEFVPGNVKVRKSKLTVGSLYWTRGIYPFEYCTWYIWSWGTSAWNGYDRSNWRHHQSMRIWMVTVDDVLPTQVGISQW